MAEVDPQRIRALKIKTGVAKRLVKEKSYYEEEAVKLQQQVNKMKENGKDEYDIRKMEEVLAESKMMIPDCDRKLKTAQEDLSRLLETEKDLADSEEYKTAKTVLTEMKS